MCLSGDIGVHAQRHIGGFAQLRGTLGQQLKLAFAFHIKKKNAAAQRKP